MGEIKKIKCLAAKTAFSLEKTITGSPVKSSRKNVEIEKDYKLMNCSPVESFHKNVKMAKSSGSPQRKRKGLCQKISTIVSNWSRFADKC